jgi:hypothetical protein
LREFADRLGKLMSAGRRRAVNATVTSACHGVWMTNRPTATAVCILRMERQGSGLLISLRQTSDIRRTSGELERSFADIDQALGAIREFMETFGGESPVTCTSSQ